MWIKNGAKEWDDTNVLLSIENIQNIQNSNDIKFYARKKV